MSTVDGAMVSDEHGTWRYPDSAARALIYAAAGYRPKWPERFPWRCSVRADLPYDPQPWVGPETVRCTLVEGHEGEHRGEVSWS